MLIKFFKPALGNADRLIDYLIRETDSCGLKRKPSPKVVGGNVVDTLRLANNLKFKHKYQTGVISFHPHDKPTEAQQRELMESFERMAFAGLDNDRYDILWVRHTHTTDNRVELHFVIPTVELETGKNLNVTWPGCLPYYRCWQAYWNLKSDWADPFDPARRQELNPGYNAYIDKQNERLDLEKLPLKKRDDAREMIHAFVVLNVEAGIIKNREGIIKLLKKAGFELNRTGKDYITVAGNDLKRPIRLNGKFYDESWRYEGEVSQKIEGGTSGKSPDKGAGSEGRIRELHEELERRIGKRAQRFSERYSPPRIYNPNSREVDEVSQAQSESPRYFTSDQSGNFMVLPEPDQLPPETPESIFEYASEKYQITTGEIGNDDGIRAEDARNLLEIQRRLRAGQTATEGVNREIKRTAEDKRRAIEESVRAFDKRAEQINTELEGFNTMLGEQDRGIGQTLQRNRDKLSKVNRDITKVIRDREELENFKTKINLIQYAESHGYRIYKKKSSRNCIAMKDGRGDRILVGIDKNDRHYFYTSLSDPTNSGSIVDFVQRQLSLNLGQVRQELRPWLSGSAPASPLSKEALPELEPATKDHFAILAQIILYKAIEEHPYLIDRKIYRQVSGGDRFYGTIYEDESGNVIFPHGDNETLTGYEIRNHGLKSFSKGGTKGIWRSQERKTDTALVVCESPLDCLSYSYIKDDEKRWRYIATGGSISDRQREIIREAFKEIHQLKGGIIFATDNDEAGQKLAQELKTLTPAGCPILFHSPALEYGKDWNEVLVYALTEDERRETELSVKQDDQLEP